MVAGTCVCLSLSIEARLIALEDRLRQTEEVLVAERLARQTAEAARQTVGPQPAGAGGSHDSARRVCPGSCLHAANWVAEHLGASSRRPRHPFSALMAGVNHWPCTCVHGHKKTPNYRAQQRACSRRDKNCNCGNHNFLHVWTIPRKLHDLHNREVDHDIKRQGNLLVTRTMGICLCVMTGTTTTLMNCNCGLPVGEHCLGHSTCKHHNLVQELLLWKL